MRSALPLGMAAGGNSYSAVEKKKQGKQLLLRVRSSIRRFPPEDLKEDEDLNEYVGSYDRSYMHTTERCRNRGRNANIEQVSKR